MCFAHVSPKASNLSAWQRVLHKYLPSKKVISKSTLNHEKDDQLHSAFLCLREYEVKKQEQKNAAIIDLYSSI